MYSGVLYRQRQFWVVGPRKIRQIGEKWGPGTASATVSVAIPATAAVSRISQHAWIGPTPRPRCPTVCRNVTACDCAVLLAAGKGRVNPDATAVATVLLPGPLTVLTFCPGQRPLGTVRLRPATPLCHYYMLDPWGDRWRIIFASVRSGIFERIPSFGKKSVDSPVAETGRRKLSGCSVPVCRKI